MISDHEWMLALATVAYVFKWNNCVDGPWIIGSLLENVLTIVIGEKQTVLNLLSVFLIAKKFFRGAV